MKDVITARKEAPASLKFTSTPNKNSKWYVVHTYSGFEHKVKLALEEHIKSLGKEDDDHHQKRAEYQHPVVPEELKKFHYDGNGERADDRAG